MSHQCEERTITNTFESFIHRIIVDEQRGCFIAEKQDK